LKSDNRNVRREFEIRRIVVHEQVSAIGYDSLQQWTSCRYVIICSVCLYLRYFKNVTITLENLKHSLILTMSVQHLEVKSKNGTRLREKKFK